MACPSTSSIPQPNKESLEDCMCTICLCILIHPVTLPCGHELCMPCFKQTVEEASLTCPLCRTRISTWARKASRTNTLVNQKRWEQIQKLFPHRVQRRLDGLDDETDEEIQEKEEVDATYRHMVQLSEPGEIRKEYEEEVKRLEAQQAAERQKEEEASAQLIQQLCSQDEQTLLETRRQQEEIVTKDSQLAEELGRLINTVESETPVNRLLQESKHNYSNYPLLPSMPSTASLPHQDGSQKGKQLLIKNSNKTLETFFRRLPSNGKRSTRSSSEPVTGVDAVSGEKSPMGVVSPRCQSAPVRGKENLPLVPHISPLHGVTDLTADTCFYEDLEMGHTFTDVQNSKDLETEGACIIEEEPVEIADRTVESQGRVVIVDVHVGRRERAESAYTVHSDGSESVIICEEPKPAEDEDEVTKDPHFRPIESSPHTPPRTLADAVPIEPCVVRITPRLLFATDCVSSTTFPIVPSPPVSTVGSSISSDRTDIPVSVTESHGQKRTVDVNHTDKAQTQVGRRGGEKESVKCKLRSDTYSTVSGVHADQNLRTRRARSTSPPTLKVIPRRQLVSCAELGKRGYRRPTLREFRMRERMQSTIEEVVSDSELSSPSPRYKLRSDRSAAHRLLRGAGDGEKFEAKARSRQMDKVVMEESSDSENEGQSPLSAPTVSQAFRSCQKTHVASSVSKRLEDQHSAMAACRTVRRETGVYTQLERDSSLAPSQASSSSNHRDMLTMIHQQGCSSSRLGGIISPVVQLGLSEDDVCNNVTTGKGKRLLKKTQDSSLSHRNCPKSSGKMAVQTRSEGVEKSGNHDTDSIAENKTCKTSIIPQHTVPKAERSNNRSRRQCNVPKRTDTEDVLSKRGKVCAASSTHSESDSEDSEKLVRKVKRPGRHQTKASVTAGKVTETTLNPNRTDKGQKKTSKTGTQKMESGVNQRSIKDWFLSSQAGPSGKNLTKPSGSSRKGQPRKGAKASDSPAVESGVSTSSSTATSPDKLAVRMSQRPRKVNPKLGDFLLTVTKKLKQFKADSCTDSDSTPAPSPTKAHTTPTLTPNQNLKRKLGDGAMALSPASKRKKQSSNPCRQILQASSSNSPEKPDQCQQQDCPASSVSSSDQTPQKLDSSFLNVGEEETHASEDDEGLSQEERDHRLALQLQQQFDLADKLNLNVVRFKGTNDQYTLRRH